MYNYEFADRKAKMWKRRGWYTISYNRTLSLIVGQCCINESVFCKVKASFYLALVYFLNFIIKDVFRSGNILVSILRNVLIKS